MSYRTGKYWQPDVTVACVVERDNRFLMVEERVAGRVVYNQPAGHLEPNESILEAAVRETLEETAWHVELSAFIGAYQWQVQETGKQYLRMAFSARALNFDAERNLDEGIIAAHWFSFNEIQSLHALHRSPLVMKTLSDYLAGQRQALSIIQSV